MTDTNMKLLATYVDTAANLAEAVKRDLQKTGKISQKTILALNAFIVAANDVESLLEPLNQMNKVIN